VVDRTGVIRTTLGADVANNGTVAFSYPTGFTQGNYLNGLAGANGYVIVNKNDKWTVAATKVSFSYGSTTITVTNTSGVTWTAGSDIYCNFDLQDGNDVINVQIPVKLAAITTNGHVVGGLKLGIYGTIENIEWNQGTPVTTAAKLTTLTASVSGTPTTGGAVALTSAACTPLGANIQGSAITAGAAITPADTLGVESTSTTAFAEGDGFLNIRIRKTAAQFA